jgi:shikimate dehydrogenase
MDRYAVAGNPVEHSQSPFIHGAFAASTGQALSYGRLLCPLDAFALTLRHFAAEGGRGCNVTVPFKFEAFALAATRTPRAELAQACNTLRFDAGGWLGDNTDGAGLCREIEHNAGVSIAGRRVLLIGAGGAAAGVLGPLLQARPAELVVANRATARAIELVERHRSALAETGLHLDARALSAAPLEACGEAFDIVVNATSSSLHGASSPVAGSVLRRGSLAIDMMYGSSAAPFLRWAEQHGAVARDGLGMLVEQAAESFALFRGVRPETEPVLAALRERMQPRAER